MTVIFTVAPGGADIIADEYVHYLSIRTRDKVVSVSLGGRVRAAGAAAAGDVGPDESPMAKSYRLLVALTSNVIEEYVLKVRARACLRVCVSVWLCDRVCVCM